MVVLQPVFKGQKLFVLDMKGDGSTFETANEKQQDSLQPLNQLRQIESDSSPCIFRAPRFVNVLLSCCRAAAF